MFRVWRLAGITLPLFLARTLTLLAVFWAWGPFRAGTLGQTVDLWRGMAGMNGVAWPSMFRDSLPLGWEVSKQVTGIELVLYLILCWHGASPSRGWPRRWKAWSLPGATPYAWGWPCSLAFSRCNGTAVSFTGSFDLRCIDGF